MTTRRNFLKQVGLATAGVAMSSIPNIVTRAATPGRSAASNGEKVKIAYIGIGNRGEQNILDFKKTDGVDVVALCDIDIGAPHTQNAISMYPDAARFRDFRDLFEKYSSHFDAVCISVPDHSHFPIAMMALDYGKHVYVEKPMCRTFYEAELMMAAAKKRPHLATQVGNQGHSEANYFQWKTWQDAGIIKDVTAITAHMNYSRRWHKFDVDMLKMPGGEPLPNSDIDWNTWLGTRPWHDYSELYHQGNWRCWYDFGLGVLGDWGAHILDSAHEFLDLGLPYEVTMKYCAGHNDFFFPYSSTILFRFGPRHGMPPCDITWYDGLDNFPELPANYGKSEYNPDIPPTNQGDMPDMSLNPGKIIYSKDITFKGGSHGSTLQMLPSEAASEWSTKLPEVPESPSDHHQNFLNACRGEEKTRSPFEINGVLTQVFCLGVIAQRLNAQLFFDPRTKKFTNNEFANALLVDLPPRRGWEDYYKI